MLQYCYGSNPYRYMNIPDYETGKANRKANRVEDDYNLPYKIYKKRILEET